MKTTKHLTTGAMTVALTTLVMLFDRATVGVFMSFLPVPLIVYGFYFGLKSSFPVYVACVVSALIFTGYLPTVLLMTGYGLIGLVCIFANSKKLKTRQTYALLVVSAIPVYVLMITQFGAFFGFEYSLAYSATQNMMPYIANPAIYHIIIIIGILILILMETFIIKTSSTVLINVMQRRFKK